MQMKRLTLFALCLLSGAGYVSAQGPYQFPNADFESWVSTGSGNAVPAHWHSFSNMQCDLTLGIGCGTAMKNHSDRIARPNGGYALQIYAKSVLGIIANGAMTTGRTRVASLNAGSPENYNYDPAGYRWPFHGRPDSIAFLARSSGGISGNALFKVFIHDGRTYYDKANGDLQGTCYGQMIIAFHPTSHWKRFAKKVTWTGSAARPSLILGSFSTNEKAGGGSSSDKLDVDALRCIYDKGLSSLSVDGVSQPGMLDAFNRAEFATHDGLTHDGSNSGIASALYVLPADFNTSRGFPLVRAQKRSPLATSVMVTQATKSTPQATITVTHNDGSAFTYIVRFAPSRTSAETAMLCRPGGE